MRLIKVTQSINNEEIFINTLRIVSVAKGANGDTVIDTQSYDGSYFGVKESVEEVLRLINEAEVRHFSHAANPATLSPDAFGMTFESLRRTDGKLEIIGGSPGLTIRCEADIKRIQELEAKLVAIKAQQRVTLKAEELRLGDVIEFPTSGGKITSISSNGEIRTSGNEMGYYDGKFVSWALARGVEVYRDGELISGWPVGSPPVRVAWSGEGLLASQLKAWEDAANIRSSVKISSPDDLGNRIAELESQLKAWQEAASVDHVENPDEPPTPCQTPEQLVERLRSLFRWATRAEERAKNSEAEANAWKEGANPDDYFAPDDEIKTPDGLARELKNLREVIADQNQEFESELAILKAKPQDDTPLDEPRVFETARVIALRKCYERTGVLSAMWATAGRAVEAVMLATKQHNVTPYKTK